MTTDRLPPLEIESARNPRFKVWEAVTEARGIRKHGLFLLAGRKTVPEALTRGDLRFEALLTTIEHDTAALEASGAPRRVILPRELFERLDVSGTGQPILVGPVPDMPILDPATPPEGREAVLALGDPSNLGAALRCLVAFDIRRVVLTAEAAHPFHPRATRAAANAVFETTFLRGPALAVMGNFAGPLLALDGGGEDIDAFAWPESARLILGEEGRGVPAELSARRLGIVTSGRVESLNAAVAIGIAAHAWYRAGAGRRDG